MANRVQISMEFRKRRFGLQVTSQQKDAVSARCECAIGDDG
jgi:hypothetical protein